MGFWVRNDKENAFVLVTEIYLGINPEQFFTTESSLFDANF